MIELYACQYCQRDQPVTQGHVALTCEFCGKTQVMIRPRQPQSDGCAVCHPGRGGWSGMERLDGMKVTDAISYVLELAGVGVTSLGQTAVEAAAPLGDRGHVWELGSSGEREYHEPINGHGGPRCTRCGYWYCEHCYDEPREDCEPDAGEG